MTWKNLLKLKKIKNTLFYKEFSEDNRELNWLLNARDSISQDKKDILNRDINLIRSYIQGDRNVYFQLKDSLVPMIGLYDIKINYQGQIVPIDYLIVTNKYIMILETKALNGDIFISETGEFIKTIKNSYGKILRKEVITNPIKVNERKIEAINSILANYKINEDIKILSKIVIPSNKTQVNLSRANEEVKKNICKYDELKEVLENNLEYYSMEKDIRNIDKIVNSFIKIDKGIKIDYSKKYPLFIEECLYKTM